MRFLVLIFAVATVLAQTPQNVVRIAPAAVVTAKAGKTADIAVTLTVDAGYHVNSNTPNDPYLIPLKLSWDKGPIEAGKITFPNPKLETFGFSGKPVSVFTGDFDIVTRFKVPRRVKPGAAAIAGKLHYQACNDRMCLPPRTIEVRVPVEVVK